MHKLNEAIQGAFSGRRDMRHINNMVEKQIRMRAIAIKHIELLVSNQTKPSFIPQTFSWLHESDLWRAIWSVILLLACTFFYNNYPLQFRSTPFLSFCTAYSYITPKWYIYVFVVCDQTIIVNSPSTYPHLVFHLHQYQHTHLNYIHFGYNIIYTHKMN